MPKNNSQTSVLDGLEQQMSEQENKIPTQATSQQPEQATSQQPAVEQEQENKVSYTPDKSEKHLYHVMLERPQYNKKTGKKLSTPFIQKFTEAEYKALTEKKSENDKSNADMLGYTVQVLWNPKENI